MCGLKPQSVLEALRIVMQQFQRGRPACRIVGDYDTDNVSMKVLRIILSYTDYVNRVVWQKPANNRCDS
jgi:UDP-N-acetylglucosamine 2-epimerase (non-hydrolysing)